MAMSSKEPESEPHFHVQDGKNDKNKKLKQKKLPIAAQLATLVEKEKSQKELAVKAAAGNDQAALAVKLREEDSLWEASMKRASGEVVRDNVKLLKKTLKLQEQKKKASKEKWAERKEKQEESMKERQMKRQKNINKKAEKAKERRMEKIEKRRDKREKRPGFEGAKTAVGAL